MKNTLLYQKIGPFVNKRLAPVSLMWLAALLVYSVASGAVNYLSDKDEPALLHLVSLSVFGDGRLVVVLSLAILALMGVFSLIHMNRHMSPVEKERLLKWTKRFWDEVSSAATHAGAAIFASVYYQSGQSAEALAKAQAEAPVQVASALALVLVGFLAFHHENTPAGATDRA